VAGRVDVVVVAGKAWPGRCQAGAVLVASGGGVDNAHADVQSGVATSDSVAASAAGVAMTISVITATAVTDAPAATCTDAAAEARHATTSSRGDSASDNAATGSIATERRGGDGGFPRVV